MPLRLTTADAAKLLAACPGAAVGPTPRVPVDGGARASLPDPRFLALLDFCYDEGLPLPLKEVRFRGLSGKRRFIWDFCWPDANPPVALEVDGLRGYGMGSHQTNKGMESNRQKDLEAQLLGWRVVRVTTKMYDRGEHHAVLRKLLGGEDNS